MGCSTGGRQGMYAARYFPEDFDGILAGAPATNFNHLLGWTAIATLYAGLDTDNGSGRLIGPNMWKVVGEEILRQCDALDGVADGVITEPDACEFRPEELLCGGGKGKRRGWGGKSDECATPEQVEALKKIYGPLYGLNGEFVFPRLDPGSETVEAAALVFNGKPFKYADVRANSRPTLFILAVSTYTS